MVACLLLLAACSPPPGTQGSPAAGVPEAYRLVFDGGIPNDQVSSVWQGFPFDAISLDEQGSIWGGPAYTVTFRRGGKAELDALDLGDLKGDYVGEIDVFEYGRLCYALENLNFRDFKDEYKSGWTDQSTHVISASSDGKTKSVLDYGGVAPIELWTIRKAIEGIRAGLKWRRRE